MSVKVYKGYWLDNKFTSLGSLVELIAANNRVLIYEKISLLSPVRNSNIASVCWCDDCEKMAREEVIKPLEGDDLANWNTAVMIATG